MKRGSGYYEGGPGGGGGGHYQPHNKRPRGDKFEIRVLVPSKVAGSVIGKGGSNIQRLRTENNSNVRIPDSPGPERIMSIVSDDYETAINVLKQSLPYMNLDSGNDGGNSSLEVRLLIHQSVVGGIIGRAGFKIKEIRENSGANIKVYQNCAPQSTDRCVAVQGPPDTIVKASLEIFQIVSQTDIKGLEEPYDPINFDSFYAHEYGGYGNDNEFGAFGGSGGDRRGSRMGSGGGGGGGRGGFRGLAPFGMNDFRSGGRGGGGGGNFGRSFPRGSGGGGGGGRPPPFGDYPPQFGPGDGGEPETVQVTIPKEMAGAIIGPGGSRIRKIRADSKASITIEEPKQGSSERIITISGNQHHIQTAQYLLQQSIRENGMGPMGGGGGGGGHYGGF